MDDSCVVSFADLRSSKEEWIKKNSREPMIEEYIDGREFTVPFLCCKTLPVCEVTYEDYPEGKPKILAQAAKWQPDSFESKHTGSLYDFCAGDTPMIVELQYLAERCIRIFHLNGWGRIDFRVKIDGYEFSPYIIDVNANSCLAQDAWFAGSLERAGITMDQAIQQILLDTQ